MSADDGSEFDLIRQIAVMLKREGVDVNTFACTPQVPIRTGLMWFQSKT